MKPAPPLMVVDDTTAPSLILTASRKKKVPSPWAKNVRLTKKGPATATTMSREGMLVRAVKGLLRRDCRLSCSQQKQFFVPEANP